MTSFDSIVLGAGFSGLVAARNLASKGHSVLVLEGRNRTGGRARSYLEGGHAPVDLGCSWVHGWAEGSPVRPLVESLGIKTHVPKPTESVIFGPNGALDPATFQKIGSNLSSAQRSLGDLAQSTTSSETSVASKLFDAGSPLFAGLKEDEKKLAEGLARTMQVGFGLPLENASLKWFGYEDNFAGTDAAPEGGYQRVTSALESKAKSDGAVFHLGETVTSISQASSGNVTVTTTTSTGEEKTYEGLTTICTLPLGVLQTLPKEFYNPPLNARKQSAISSTHVGELAKVVLTYPSAWWPKTTGTFILLPSSPPVEDPKTASVEDLLRSVALVVSSFASGALPNEHPTLLTYVASPISTAIETLPQETVVRALHGLIAANLSTLPSSSPVQEPAHSVITSWSSDPFARGATSTPSPTGSNRSPLNFLELGRAEWSGRLGFAGEHTDVHHRGSVNGAVESGIREAGRVDGVLRRLRDKEQEGDKVESVHKVA